MAIDGRTQSECPAALTITGRTNAATSSITVASVTARSIRLPSALRGLGAVPAVTLAAYAKAASVAMPDSAISNTPTVPPMA